LVQSCAAEGMQAPFAAQQPVGQVAAHPPPVMPELEPAELPELDEVAPLDDMPLPPSPRTVKLPPPHPMSAATMTGNRPRPQIITIPLTFPCTTWLLRCEGNGRYKRCRRVSPIQARFLVGSGAKRPIARRRRLHTLVTIPSEPHADLGVDGHRSAQRAGREWGIGAPSSD
jgi:hypothetical protein